MALTVFGVTYTNVRTDMFPQWGAFDANSSPTSTTVTTFINEEAADLAGRLYAEGVSATAVELLVGGVAYTWCAKTLKLMAARRIFAVATQGDPELRKAYGVELDARLALLDEKGATALGDESLDTGDSPADGPTTHINQFNLTTLSASDMSSAAPKLKADDQL